MQEQEQLDQSESWRAPVGDVSTTVALNRAPAPVNGAVCILGHGASVDMEHPTMRNLARALNAAGVNAVRFNFLYKELHKGPPDRMPRLVETYLAVLNSVREHIHPDRIYIGGHSMGGRAASMMAAEGCQTDGLILFAYPLHPAGQPEKLRDAHLTAITSPVICFNGTRDDLCTMDLMNSVVSRLPSTWTMHWLEGADHGFHVQKRSGRTDEDVLDEVSAAVREWTAESK